MALTQEDKKYITDQIASNNKELIIQFAQIFPTKVEVKEIVNESLIEVKDRLSRLEDTTASILYRLDIEELPFIERRIDIIERRQKNLEDKLTKIENA